MEAAVALPHALAAHSITVPHLSHNYPTSPQHSHSRPTNKARDGRDHLDGAPDVYVVGTAAVRSVALVVLLLRRVESNAVYGAVECVCLSCPLRPLHPGCLCRPEELLNQIYFWLSFTK